MIDADSIIPIEPSDTILFDLAKRFGPDAPLKRIFQVVLAQGCKVILKDKECEEEEWTSEHNIFYSKLFKKYSDKTERLHFFAEELHEKDLANLSKFKDTYLGFAVLRPLKEQRIVYAVIKPLVDKNDPPKSFVLCQETFPVEVNTKDGIPQTLEVCGFPFMQQDGQAGCCAHAALIMADRFLVQRRNKGKPEEEKEKPHFLEEISKLLSVVPGEGRKIPTSGLRPIEISEALAGMKYSPLVYEYVKGRTPAFPSERVIYHYLESRIPVQLVIPTAAGRHVLTVIGHSFDPDVWWALAHEPYYKGRPSGGDYHCSTTWIGNFIVNDDNFGPYLTIPKEYLWPYEESGQLVVAVPLPLHVNMEGESAESYSNYLLSWEVNPRRIDIPKALTENKISKDTCDLYELMWDHYRRNDLVLRTFLLDSETFREKHVPHHLKDDYNKVRLPEKIWLTEISIPELFCQPRLRLGEIVIDPTAPSTPLPLSKLLPHSKAVPPSYLVIHVPGYIKTRDVDTEDTPRHYIYNDRAYKHVIRKK